MSTEARKYTVLIVGAGIAGLTLALTILKNPPLSSLYTPILIERLPSAESNSSEDDKTVYSYAVGTAVVISSNALYPLIKLGLKEDFEAISQEVKNMKIWRCYGSGEGKGKFLNEMNHPNWAQDLDSGLRVVERVKLQELLIGKISELGGEIIWGEKVLDVVDGGTGVELHFLNGGKKRGDLVVGADGGWSGVRRRIAAGFGDPEEKLEGSDGTEPAKDEWMPLFQNSSGIYGISPLPQTVLDDPDFEEKVVGNGHVVMLDTRICSTWPLPNGYQFWNITNSEEHPPPTTSQTLTSSKYPNSTINTGGYPLESTEELMESFANIWHPLSGNFNAMFERSERIVRGALWQKVWEEDGISNGKNTIVIGDAGRVMLPSSGQGACMAIEDATVLADSLLKNPPTFTSFDFDSPANFSVALQHYAALRIPRSKSIASQAYWTGLVSMGERWWWRWVRDLSTTWLKMDTNPKETAKNNGQVPKDYMDWLYGVRLDVGVKEGDEES
ncbi:hypothetical protein RUND412_009528 [Rhizina undulata]